MVFTTPSKKRGRAALGQQYWGGYFDENEYPRGSIKRVRMENFMTYKQATVYPGPRLNLVLGPNGSGKSSVVCAIGLCLCASSKKLGRADSIKEFVRKGEEKALVELIISGGPDEPDFVVERELHAGDNKSVFRVNNIPKGQQDIQDLNLKLNIQLDNLCQFLPQEKVVEFSKMTPKDLLISTERAIGDASLLHMHEDLIAKDDELDKLANAQQTLERQVNNKLAEQERMQKDVEKVQKCLELRVKADQHKLRVLQLDQAEKQGEAAAAQARLRQKQVEYEKIKRSIDQSSAPIQALAQEQMQVTQQEADLRKAKAELARDLDTFDDQVATSVDKLEELKKSIEACDNTEAKRRQDLEINRKMLEKKCRELEDTPEEAPGVDHHKEQELKDQRRKVSHQLSLLTAKKGDLERDRSGLKQDLRTVEHSLDCMKQEAHQRIKALERKHHGIGRFQEAMLERKRRNEFRGAVYGPVASEIRLRPDAPPFAARVLEHVVPNRVMAAFVVEHRADQDLLRSDARKLNASINVICYTADASAPISHPQGDAAAFGTHGVLASLDNIFDCANLVKKVLCEQAGLNTHYLVADDGAVDGIFQSTPLMKLASAQFNHSKKVSKYNANGVSLRQDELNKMFLLASQVDEQALQEKQQECHQLSADLQMLEQQLQQNAAEHEQMNAQRHRVDSGLTEIQERRNAHDRRKYKLKMAIEKCENDIKKLDKQAPLLRKPELEREMDAERSEQQKKLTAIVQKMERSIATYQDLALCVVKRCEIKERLEQLKRGKRTHEHTRQELENAIREYTREHDKADKAAKDVSKEAQAAMKALATQAKRSVAELQAEVDALPEDADTCEAEAEQCEEQVNQIVLADQGVLERYRKGQAELKKQQAERAAKQAKMEQLVVTIHELKARWQPQLQAAIATISEKFSKNFERIGSRGKVELHSPNSEEGGRSGFSDYEVRIKVKFRDVEGAHKDDLEVLTAGRHSGGEKSVSTIMYLLSLQKLTDTPFRVVDEINQGMDQTNERRVFQAMVDAATERSTAQCLLMTPKLLPQLEYSEHVNVLCVFNGPHIHEVQRQLVPAKQLKLLMGTHAPMV